jgi:hypothetical protein
MWLSGRVAVVSVVVVVQGTPEDKEGKAVIVVIFEEETQLSLLTG